MCWWYGQVRLVVGGCGWMCAGNSHESIRTAQSSEARPKYGVRTPLRWETFLKVTLAQCHPRVSSSFRPVNLPPTMAPASATSVYTTYLHSESQRDRIARLAEPQNRRQYDDHELHTASNEAASIATGKAAILAKSADKSLRMRFA